MRIKLVSPTTRQLSIFKEHQLSCTSARELLEANKAEKTEREVEISWIRTRYILTTKLVLYHSAQAATTKFSTSIVTIFLSSLFVASCRLIGHGVTSKLFNLYFLSRKKQLIDIDSLATI